MTSSAASLVRRKLPIGIQTFREIREEGYYYVDKTAYAWRLVSEGKYYFLSRPRRFGKSLFLDTLAELFAGNEPLFRGLYIHDRWDWNVRYPVVRLSFAEGRLQTATALDEHIHVLLSDNADRLGVTIEPPPMDTHLRFKRLIERVAEKAGQRVVVLVDEYDKPILDNLTTPEVARAMREGLRNLYSVIKGQDAHIRFAFLTGVSKFSKVSIFSGLNNLADITLSEPFATICGYTEADLDTVFAPEFAAAAAEGKPLSREAVRSWYNGYSWGGNERVYNPFDVLQLFFFREFRAWWFETGSPTFLIDLLKARRFFTPQLERLYATEELLSAFDVDGIEPEAILWQTGYLTIGAVHVTAGVTEYELKLPNREVRMALNRALTAALIPTRPTASVTALINLMRAGDLERLRDHFQRLYASIPHDWYRKNPITHYEGYWASVFYSHLAALGLELIAEDVTHHGCIDLTVKLPERIYLFEFKVVADEPEGAALAQLRAKGYAEKYRGQGVPVHLVGVEFSKRQRNVVAVACETC
ncbi:ATP-binding protein [Hydrogenophilus thermoluteolus]|nr:ATP-binding protein [Hydrogenophilus thermoluteolus]MBW7657615.1 ATP-binding protein [Hydrogenophilus thermoluteolus]